MRIALTNWSRRVVGGTEGYVQAVLPALAARGVDVALWTERDGADDRALIEVPGGGAAWCVADQGAPSALAGLRGWRPDLSYGHGLYEPANAHDTPDIAPGVFFAHTDHGICISGTKTFTRPDIEACHRPFGLGCLGCYYPRRCGGLNPLVALGLYRTQAARLKSLARYDRILTDRKSGVEGKRVD